ncbi:MAG: hypothetical protein R2685_07995 [Candidatus Nitrosocosmicus sp.]|nr:hypothetical protein [Candidatus Nitrosocosmicus sp.]
MTLPQKHTNPIDYICKICREHLICNGCYKDDIRSEHTTCFRCLGAEDGISIKSRYVDSFNEGLK